jgi:hypothetical protein
VTGQVQVDGVLDEPAWRRAAVVEDFWETVFADNRPPHVSTRARLMYDDRHFYVGLLCQDPEPSRIRAPYVDRDQILGDQDNVAVFLDTRNDRRAALEFRVNPRGIQADAVYNDATQTEDFAPDFYYDTAARITAEGWQAEMRIPLSSLRYPRADPQTWGILIWRNLPREFRYAIFSSPQPPNPNCVICFAHDLVGLTRLPNAGHLVLAPYLRAQDVAAAPAPGSPLGEGEKEAEAGLDVKWTPAADTAVDLTANPDFSQVEADVAQIAVNNRFALFYPEKRPFFLEGTDLLESPITAVYSRTITAPRWGLRTTGKLGGAAYTVLVGEDRGGGSVVLPGPTSSGLAPQDYRSAAGIARFRHDLGGSFAGVLYAGREIDGGGFNRVLGPDFQWRPSSSEQVTGQALFSWTETPGRPDLVPEWDGSRRRGHAAEVVWLHTTRRFDWYLRGADRAAGFRADLGFVPQVGVRAAEAEVGYTFFPGGLLAKLRPYVVAAHTEDRDGALVLRRVVPGIGFLGQRNLYGFMGYNVERVRTGARLLDRRFARALLQADPARWLSRVSLSGFVGDDVDLEGERLGRGGSFTASATLRPSDHLSLEVLSSRSWLDVPRHAGGPRQARLFTAQVQRLKATHSFTSRAFLRLVGQYVETHRDPSLHARPVPRREGAFQVTALLSYRLNWQTALFLGYGDDRVLDEDGRLRRDGRQAFFKVSYSLRP